MDEQQRDHIRDDLQGLFRGELLFDDLTRHLYSTDASIFEIKPTGVAQPRDEEDLQALVRYAHEQGVPLIARGAGTGIAGESLGMGLIVDLTKHFRSILEVGTETVRVQPGVTYSGLNQRLAQIGRRFAPDPASGAVCTLGGMLATDASGARSLKYGYTHDYVDKLRIVLDQGDCIEVGREPVPKPGDPTSSHLGDILTALGVLLEPHAETIRSAQPKTRFHRCGYRLDQVLVDGKIDLPRLLIGSEGTLAFFTEATLRTIPISGGRAMTLLGFGSVEAAVHAAQLALPSGPSACELMDRRLLSLARGSDAGKVAALVSPLAEAVLLIEYEADSSAEALRRADELANLLRLSEHRPLQISSASEPADYDQLWQLREVALPSLYSLKGGAQPLPFVEDIGVPIENLQEFLRRAQEILQEQETTASFLIHAGSGQVHTRPFLDLQRTEDRAKIRDLAEKIHTLGITLGGTVSSQHGTGLARTPWVSRQAGPLYPIYRQVKAIFDPKNLFNPGKIVDPDPQYTTWPLRNQPRPEALPLRLLWQPQQFALETAHCNGCGLCRSVATDRRMCPVYHATGDEQATPRAKANLLRALLEVDPKQLSSDEVRAIADLCFHCKSCEAECPAHVNIPKLMLETKAANVAEHGLDRVGWFLSNMEEVLRWGSSLSFLTNRMVAGRVSRWLFSKLVGLSSQRRMPRFTSRPFLSRARRLGWTKRTQTQRLTVVYFVDLYANYLDPQVAEATVAVLRKNGFDVYVPPEQRSSGIEALVQGDVELARELAQKNLRVLAELAREGLPIICSEPSAAMMLRQDYLDLFDDSDAHLVAKQTVELTTFLWDLHQRGKLNTDFQPLDLGIGHHIPCHIKALGSPAGPKLLGLIPKLRVHPIDLSCSGMGGTFGLEHARYQTSLAAGAPMLHELARPRSLFGASECSSCRMQMEDGARKRTLHPVQYLALAYGLMPSVAKRLREPIRDLVLR